MNNIELRRLTKKSIEHSDRLMIYQDNENNEGNYVTIDDIQIALLDNLIVNIEEYQEITEQNNSYTVDFLNKPFGIINLTGSTTKNVYFNNLFESCTGKILIFQNGSATLKFPDGIHGKVDLPLQEGSIVLVNYFILSKDLYVYSTIIVGPSKTYAYQDLSNVEESVITEKIHLSDYAKVNQLTQYANKDLSNVDSDILKTKVGMDNKANTDLSNVSNSVIVTKSGVESKANKTLDNVDNTIAMNKSSIYKLEGSDQSYMALVYKISDDLYHSIGINSNGQPVSGTGNNLEEYFTEKVLMYQDLSNVEESVITEKIHLSDYAKVNQLTQYANKDLSNVDSDILKTKVGMDNKANTDLSNVSNSVIVTKSGVESKANKTLDNVDNTIAMNKSSIYKLEGSDQSYMALVYKISDDLYHSIGINSNGQPVSGTGNNLEEYFTEKVLMYQDLSNCLTIKAINTSGLDTATDSNSIYLVKDSSSNVNGRYIMMVFKPYITSSNIIVQIRISTSGVIESRSKVDSANWTDWTVYSDNRYLKIDLSNSTNIKLNANQTIINSPNISGNSITVVGRNNTGNKNNSIILGKSNKIEHDNVIAFGNSIYSTIKEKCIHTKIDNLNIVHFSHIMTYPINTLHNMVILFPPLDSNPISIVIDCITAEYNSTGQLNRSGALRCIIVGLDENIYTAYDTTNGATSLEFHYSDTEGLYMIGSDNEKYELNLDVTVKYED